MKLLKISLLSAMQKYLTLIFSLIFFISWHNETLCSQSADSRQINSGQDDISFPARVVDLNGNWEFKATDETEWMPAVVPSTVHSDLLRVGRLPDPFFRDNELKVQWVEKKEWEYRRFFNIESSYLSHDKIILDCRGLDTISEIYLNDSLVAETINMFIEYQFDVRPFLREGKNEIHIIFRSILEWNKQQVAADPRVTEDFITPKGNVFFARKTGSNFGWNWGIRLLTCGIFRPIYLRAYEGGRILDLGVSQDLSDLSTARLNVTAHIENYKSRNLLLHLSITSNHKSIAETRLKVSSGKVTDRLKIRDPELWWPNGWGDHPLYTISAELYDGKKMLHQKSIRIGLRTVELVREPDQRGETFGFRVNGKRIFCKGANWIPADILSDRFTAERCRQLLRSCVEANMNMIRVWGGGQYEPDFFYDYCDENGLMVWQDFMFAVGPFLDSPDYLENVGQEVTNVVQRLRHHPAIVLWCGNNEQDDNMIRPGGYLEQYPVVSWESYDKLFQEVIPQTAAVLDPDRPYWPCSPHHSLDRERKTTDWEKSSGDAHVWDVWHGGFPISWFEENPDFRFVSEYGFAAYSTMETIRSFTSEEDRRFGSVVMEHHHKERATGNQDYGDTRIARQMARLFGLAQGFENFVYVSQLLQAEAMKIASEAYRRNYPQTQGALYWQVNENWPTTCKSGMDYYGRWKALQYLTCHFFNPVLVSGQVKGSRVLIWGVNDRREDVSGKLSWCLYRLDGIPIKTGEQSVQLRANRSSLLAEFDLQEVLAENPEYRTYLATSYDNRKKYIFSYQLVQENKILSANFETFVPYKYLELQNPSLTYTIDKSGNFPTINLTSAGIALFVELGLKESYARFSDNYFLLLPGETRSIQVRESEIPVEQFDKQFYLKSLVDAFTE